MWNDTTEIINSVYGMVLDVSAKQAKLREAKVKAAIEYLGDKYCLAKPVEKLNG